MSVTKVDNSDEVVESIRDAVTKAMETIGQMAVANAKQIVPVDTGALKDSIDSAVSKQESTISTTVYADTPYAAYVELGTSMQRAQPYLKPAVTDHTGEYVNVLASQVATAISS